MIGACQGITWLYLALASGAVSANWAVPLKQGENIMGSISDGQDATEERSLQAYSDAIAHIQGESDSGAFKLGDDISPLVYAILKSLGEDPSREGLRKTPGRADEAMKFLTKGYHENLDEIVNDALFESDNDDIVLIRNIEIFSLCEHHLLPFIGKAHIAYIPQGKVVGLSKIPRIADMFARRLQLQERLTDQIVDAIVQVLNPKGAAVILECQHLCMMMRGVEKVESTTLTRAFRGAFKSDQALRQEFLELIS